MTFNAVLCRNVAKEEGMSLVFDAGAGVGNVYRGS
jgi:hypothetical protein